ncbi:hypothetical protein Sme01_48800 [Sphaerisporangium melleum]|uniref:DUF3618 domain-containing protein n=1 Tax=Sphaerisporangium melleum TaxID=321316 RepID=A0A917R465_9ACTN|nr:DUF3618 domain-containing protein [Sphaerisporangium melleum]GGK87449.1 hypothetical protein GCM10007964_32480 [Sphaerisporangium melleum]GII72404.1 hypothetical protein Sme01_48800 [Sphaerisporangium melleum]
MTEDPILRATQRPTAGEVGLHRQEPGTATPESAGPSLNVPEVHAPHKPYVKPVVSHGRGDPLAGLAGTPVRAAAEPEESGEPGGAGSVATGPAQAPPDGRSGHGRTAEADRLRDDIERTREELGRTVEALAHKVDVKSRAQRKIAETRTAAKEKAAGMADRLRGGGRSRPSGAGTEAGAAGPSAETAPGRLKDMAGQVSEQARRRPEMIIAAGAATMAGVGLLTWAQRRVRPGTAHQAWHAARRARARASGRRG